ncbi:MAG: radical SAM protein [Euryarchaeota archaeon]|nr:radical SAM protein [Euryarchaeota archaeon]
MRVLLVQPPSTEISLNQLSPHIGLAYIGAVLLRAGHHVEALDAQAERLRFRDLEKIRRRIETVSPDAIGITSATTQIHYSHLIAGQAKQVDSGIATIAGGYHPGAMPRETLEEFPHFDFAIAGEAEMTMLELVEALENGGDVSTIRGIAYRADGQVHLTEPRPWNQDLDSLPFPAFELFPLQKYRPIFTPREKVLQLPASSTRGCPYSCTFCYRSQGRTLRERSVGNIIREIQWDIEKFEASQIFFVDDTFAVNRKRALEFCEVMVRLGLHEEVTWVCASRVDRVDPGLLQRMRGAGCTHIAFGVESGNQMLLARTQKNITIEQSRSAVQWAKEAGMSVHTMYILGIPGETRESAQETIEFALELDSDTANFAILTAYPGTEVMRMAERGEEGMFLETKDWREYGKHSGSGALASTSISRRELEKLQIHAYLRFYLRRGKLRKAPDVINVWDIPRYLGGRIPGLFSGGSGPALTVPHPGEASGSPRPEPPG